MGTRGLRKGGLAATTLLGLAVAGCALPVPVMVASYVADGMLLAATGKTAGDAAVSAASDRDCAFWRVLQGEPICHDYPDGRTPVQVAELPGAAAGGEGGVPVPIDVVLARAAANQAGIVVAALPPVPANRPAAGLAEGPATVRMVQSYLIVLGYEAGPVDGVVGPRTRGAMTAYSQAIELPEQPAADIRFLRRLAAPQGLPDLALASHLADAG